MTKIEDLAKQVYEKLSRELRVYKKELKEQSIDIIILKSYETTIKNEFPDMFYGTGNYSEYELKALLELENTLDALYNDWYHADGGIHNVLEDTIADYIMDLADEYVDREEDKIKGKNTYELTRNITDALKDFDNYEFCEHLKRKFDIEEFDLITVDKLLNNKDGISSLRYLFDELKNNDDLSFLNTNMVINSENYNNIEKKIIPQLNELIAEKNKNKIKETREER